MQNSVFHRVAVTLRIRYVLVVWLAILVANHAAYADSKVKTVVGEEKLLSEIIGDRAAVVHFIYTRCEGVCPGQGQRFKALQKLLGDRLGKDVTLISLSIDPERDSLADLKAWGDRYQATRGWVLVRAERKETDALCQEMLGMTLTTAEHSPFVAVRRKGGVWERIYGFSSARDIISRIDHPTPSIQI